MGLLHNFPRQGFASAKLLRYCAAMSGDRVESAVGRIEAALARIEAAASHPRANSSELELRHDRLRSAVTQSLRQLDSLIAGHGE
jgi:hypothetical protein